MTIRSGVDLLEISRLKEALEKYGERFLARIYTPAECELCAGNPASLAVRFAAKEAVAKALGTGLGDVSWTEIEILRADTGAPQLHLHGKARVLAGKLGLTQWSISLSHTRENAIALAVASS
jgi:holo-[acyl-carrier protein] synthase